MRNIKVLTADVNHGISDGDYVHVNNKRMKVRRVLSPVTFIVCDLKWYEKLWFRFYAECYNLKAFVVSHL